MWVPSNTCKGSYSVHLAENPQPALKSLWRYLAGSHCLPGKDSTGCFRKFHLAFSGLILSPWTLSFFWRLAMSLPGPWVQETVSSLHSWVLPESRHFPGTHSFYRRGSDPSEIHPSITFACMLSHVWLCDPMGCSLPGSSVHGIFQARILEWVAIYYSRRSSLPKSWILVSCISCTGRQILYHCNPWEALNYPW